MEKNKAIWLKKKLENLIETYNSDLLVDIEEYIYVEDGKYVTSFSVIIT